MPDLPRNPTPRAEFGLSASNVQRHGKLIESPVFQTAIATALAEYQRELASASQADERDFNRCAAAHLKLVGANRFIDILLNLAEPPARPRVTPLSQNLREAP